MFLNMFLFNSPIRNTLAISIVHSFRLDDLIQSILLSIPQHTSIRTMLVPINDWVIRIIHIDRFVAGTILLSPISQLVPISTHSLLAETRMDGMFAGLRVETAGEAECVVRIAHDIVSEHVCTMHEMLFGEGWRDTIVRIKGGFAEVGYAVERVEGVDQVHLFGMVPGEPFRLEDIFFMSQGFGDCDQADFSLHIGHVPEAVVGYKWTVKAGEWNGVVSR